jgi:multiple sugar transport system substrate-binding protein
MGHKISRRRFLKAAGIGALALGFSPFRVSGQPPTLKIIQWQHFVPAHDKWFDAFAKEWGQKRNPPVNVEVEHISFADIIPRAKAIVAAKSGPDLYGFLSPPSQFIEDVIDHTDIIKTLESKYGPYSELARRSTFNPRTNTYFGVSNMWTIDPWDYHKDVWSAIGFPNGPSTLQDLLVAGDRIRQQFTNIPIPIGVGFSQDIDSNMAMRAILWSHDASIQDENEQVVLNSPQTLEAIRFAVELFKRASPEVLTWNAASNNQAFNARATSIILNSISAYRAAQDNNLALPGGGPGSLADNTFFTAALKGPRGTAWASEHVMHVYVIWKFSKQQDLAKEFLAYLVANARAEALNSKLYDTPSFLGAMADPDVPVAQKPRAGYLWLKGHFEKDPNSHRPNDPAQTEKLKVLFSAVEEPLPDGTVKPGWATNIGHPGPANPAISQIFDDYVLVDMFAKAATGRLTPEQALAEANARVKQIFNSWRQRGLVGGDPAKDK